MKFTAYMAFSFITFSHILLVTSFVILYMVVCLYASVFKCVNYVFFIFMYSYNYVCNILYSVYCLYVNVSCTAATECQPNCSYIYYIIFCVLFHCVVLIIVCVQMCTVLLPTDVNPIAVNKCIKIQ
jgi:hypothetical protein